ncbi:MbtH family protein [Streptomyces sp. NPDC051921]|uniref:MbtH family protein n=1 Tax=Streptomyces sp. NPDC051921 TaxID=3155806 RepID=UPI0034439A5B
MTNPFDRDDIEFLVVVNHENQHSIWPARTDVPEGWRQVHGPAGRAESLAYVEEHWTDIRPSSSLTGAA